ncbi:hypothetical protein ZWY2020_036306 [Hordeum vulgare]|nr:hypothetical protein ZWY2020_036306 [Hordeum vulgare]
MLYSTHSRGTPLFHAEDTWCPMGEDTPRLFRRPIGSTSLFCCTKKGHVTAPTMALSIAMKVGFGEKLSLRDTIRPVSLLILRFKLAEVASVDGAISCVAEFDGSATN